MKIEVEIRSFISREKYRELLEFFKRERKLIEEDYQETFYFDCPEDLRIQKNNRFSKIWLKAGKIHDEAREEIEVKFRKKDFSTLEKLLGALGYNIEIKWFRKRNKFFWKEVTVCVDYTKGYGYIIELEKRSDEQNKDEILKNLKELLKTLKVKQTSREEFDRKFDYYKANWEELTKD